MSILIMRDIADSIASLQLKPFKKSEFVITASFPSYAELEISFSLKILTIGIW